MTVAWRVLCRPRRPTQHHLAGVESRDRAHRSSVKPPRQLFACRKHALSGRPMSREQDTHSSSSSHENGHASSAALRAHSSAVEAHLPSDMLNRRADAGVSARGKDAVVVNEPLAEQLEKGTSDLTRSRSPRAFSPSTDAEESAGLSARDKKAITLLVVLCKHSSGPHTVIKTLELTCLARRRVAGRARRACVWLDPVPAQGQALVLADRPLHPVHLPILAQAALEPHRRLVLEPAVGSPKNMDLAHSGVRRLHALVALDRRARSARKGELVSVGGARATMSLTTMLAAA